MFDNLRHLIYSWDKKLFYWINSDWQNSVLDLVMPFITNFSHWRFPLFLLLLALFIWGGKKGRWAVVLGIIAVGLSDFTSSQLLKPLFSRVRPCNVFPDVHLLVKCSKSFSFPSNHAVNFFSTALLFTYFYKKTGIFLFFMAVLVALSRVYVGVHYPLDTLAGAIWGLFGGTLILILANKIFRDKIQSARKEKLKWKSEKLPRFIGA